MTSSVSYMELMLWWLQWLSLLPVEQLFFLDANLLLKPQKPKNSQTTHCWQKPLMIVNIQWIKNSSCHHMNEKLYIFPEKDHSRLQQQSGVRSKTDVSLVYVVWHVPLNPGFSPRSSIRSHRIKPPDHWQVGHVAAAIGWICWKIILFEVNFISVQETHWHFTNFENFYFSGSSNMLTLFKKNFKTSL